MAAVSELPNSMTRSVKEQLYSSPAQALEIVRDVLLGQPTTQLIEGAAIEAFISVKQGVILTLGALGPYACMQEYGGDKVVVSMAGTPTQSTFYSFARSKLRSSNEEIVIESSNEHEYIMFKLYVNGITFELSYHQSSPEQIDQLWKLSAIPNHLPYLVRKHYTDRVKTIQLAKVYKSQPNQMYFACIEAWIRELGLLSPKFNFLGPDDILSITAIAASTLPASADSGYIFRSLSSFSTLPAVHPLHNLVAKPSLNKTTMSGLTILQGLESISKLADDGAITGKLNSFDGWSEFACAHANYLQVNLSYWGLSRAKGARFMRAVESILAGFLSRLEIRLYPRLKLRPWPMRMMCQMVEDSYEASYFVGEDCTDDVLSDVRESIPVLLRDEIIEHQSYDHNLAYVDVAWTPRMQEQHWQMDVYNWGPVPEDRKPEDDDDDDIPAEDLEVEGYQGADLSKKKASARAPVVVDDWTPRHALRPALHVLHRIKSDGAMDSADYLVGYLDRHTGMKEMAVERWILKEETAEEFIPQSRIRYFKRVSDGVTVWDREARSDLVFGSGKKVREVSP